MLCYPAYPIKLRSTVMKSAALDFAALYIKAIIDTMGHNKRVIYAEGMD